MRRKLHSGSQDSLDLLLDTLCNLFGGIVLIACLLAIVTRQSSDTSPVTLPETAVLEKKLASARAELTGLEKLREELQQARSPALDDLLTQRDSLQAAVSRLRSEKETREKMNSDTARKIVSDAEKEREALKEQLTLERLRLENANKESSLASAAKKAAEDELHERVLELERANQAMVEKLRFPRERDTPKAPSPIIVRFGQVHPVETKERNTHPSVEAVPGADGNRTITPIKGQGLDPKKDAAVLRSLLPVLSRGGHYLTIYVYPDSFDTFRELKQLVLDLGLEYGLDICPEGHVLVFGERGTKPAPL